MRPQPRASLFRIGAVLVSIALPGAGCDAGPDGDDDGSLSRVAGPTSEWPAYVPPGGKGEVTSGGSETSGGAAKPGVRDEDGTTNPATVDGSEAEQGMTPSKQPDSVVSPPDPPRGGAPVPSTPAPGSGGLGASFDAGISAPQLDAGTPAQREDSGHSGDAGEAQAADAHAGTRDAGSPWWQRP